MLRQRRRQQWRRATNHAEGFAPAMRTPEQYQIRQRWCIHGVYESIRQLIPEWPIYWQDATANVTCR